MLHGMVVPRSSTTVSRRELERNDDTRRVLVWLLRKHFERHLQSFEPDGLIMEHDVRYRRAYFQGLAAKPRTLVYDGALRKGIRRQVVKQRAEGPKTWFENEGIGYEVCQLDGEWAIRIKPFYMFTGRDGRTPLPAFARTARATRRIKYDRNKNVEDDLTFWSKFLSRGASTINVGQESVGDLLLDSSFVTVEVDGYGNARPGFT